MQLKIATAKQGKQVMTVVFLFAILLAQAIL